MNATRMASVLMALGQLMLFMPHYHSTPQPQDARGREIQIKRNPYTKSVSLFNGNETIVVSDDLTIGQSAGNETKLEFCDKISVSQFGDRSMVCVHYNQCHGIKDEASEQVRELACSIQPDGTVGVCCRLAATAKPTANPPDLDPKDGASLGPAQDPAEEEPDDPELEGVVVSGRQASRVNQSETVIIVDQIADQAAGGLSPVNKEPRALEPKDAPSAGQANKGPYGAATRFPKDCGTTSELENLDEDRIIGGQTARRNAWPWFALLTIKRRASGGYSPECGGTLVSDRFVLTAAHCVLEQGRRSLRPAQLRIKLGEFDLNSREEGELDVGVARVIPHPNFRPKTFKNDIALLELDTKVNSSLSVAPACLPHDDLRLADPASTAVDNQTAWILGFGHTSYNGRASDVLKQADLRIVPHLKCKRAFGHLVRLSLDYVCASSQMDPDSELDGQSQRKMSDSCQGDSGGPLLMKSSDSTKPQRWYLYGIVSFGYKCASVGFPGVYTRVNRYLSWVHSHL